MDGEGSDGIESGKRVTSCVIVVVLPTAGVPQIKILGKMRIMGAWLCHERIARF